MKSLIWLFLLGSSALANERFYCNAKALSPAERQRYNEVSGKLFAAVSEKSELKNGYGFHLSAKELPLAR